MNIFKPTKDIDIVCESESLRDGFRHRATVFVNGHEELSTTIKYYNRTWEAYTYQSVLRKAIEKSQLISQKEKLKLKPFIDNGYWPKKQSCSLKSYGKGMNISHVHDLTNDEEARKVH